MYECCWDQKQMMWICDRQVNVIREQMMMINAVHNQWGEQFGAILWKEDNDDVDYG